MSKRAMKRKSGVEVEEVPEISELEIPSHAPDSDDDDDEDEEDIDSEPEATSTAASTFVSTGRYTNKQRVLILASRGITARYRHLLEDLKQLIPHHKKDSKLDSKGDIQVVNEIAEMKSCNQILYLETRKHQDLYMYLGKTPHGPTAKFHVVNVHTMDELKLTGNCMQGSRPLLNFDLKFESSAHWQLMKGLLTDAFGTPRGHPKSKPFLDHIMSFFIIKNNICTFVSHHTALNVLHCTYCLFLSAGVRNFQIVDKSERKSDGDMSLVEIGPRFVLIPIRVFSGSLGGATLYQNPAFVSPNEERSSLKRRKGYVRVTDRHLGLNHAANTTCVTCSHCKRAFMCVLVGIAMWIESPKLRSTER